MTFPFDENRLLTLACTFILMIVLFCIVYRLTEYFKRKIKPPFSLGSNIWLFLLFGLGLCSYFLTGDILGGDAHTHTGRTWLFADILSKGEIPIWTNKWYLGYPIGLYYGFLYYFLTGATATLTGLSPILVTKLLLVLFHAASGFAVFYLAFLCCKDSRTALFASLFYVYSFQHTGIIILAGALPLGLVFLLLPLLFISMERVYEIPDRSLLHSGILAAVLVSCLFFTHIQYGFYAVICFFSVVIIRVVLLFIRRNNRCAWALVKFLFITGIAAMILSSWFLIPFIAEKRYLFLSSQNSIKNLTGHFSWPMIIDAGKRIMIPSRRTSWHFFYFGCIPLIITGFGLIRGFHRNGRTDSRVASYTITFILGLPLAVTSRYINIWFLLACLISAWGILFILNSHAAKRFPGLLKKYLFLILVSLLLLDCGMTLVQRSYHCSLPAFDFSEKNTSAGRLAVLHQSSMTLWRSLDFAVTGRASIFGGIPQLSTKAHPYVAAICTRAVVDILDSNKDLDGLSRDAFRILNVSKLVIPDQQRTCEFKQAAPAIFAARAVQGQPDYTRLEKMSWLNVRARFEDRTLDYALTDEIIEKMRIHSRQPVADAIVMHPSLTSQEVSCLNNESRHSESAEFAILNSSESHTHFTMEYLSSVKGIIQLSFAYFPYLKVSIDGKPVEIHPSALGLIVIQAPAGRHIVSVDAGVSGLRIQLLILGMAGILLLAVISVVSTCRRKIQIVRVMADNKKCADNQDIRNNA
ncbi:hypothetical protein JW835_08485 [bacterium]|nr:hypothetical protein [bacterium]